MAFSINLNAQLVNGMTPFDLAVQYLLHSLLTETFFTTVAQLSKKYLGSF